MSFRFQFRRGTTAERNASNPILAAGEPAVVLDSGQPAELVLGDGVTAMADLRAAVWDDDTRLALADTATQPGDLGTAAAADVGDFATSLVALAPTDRALTPTITMLQRFTTGHGWTISGSGTGTTADSTEQAAFGTQSVKFTPSGGDGKALLKSGFTLDLTTKELVLWLRADTATAYFAIYAGDTGLANYYLWVVQVEPYEGWKTVVLPWSRASATGSPVRSAIQRLQIRPLDGPAGYAGGIGHQPIRDDYPNGVVSITFDDGLSDAFNKARPSMDAYGYGGTGYLLVSQTVLTAEQLHQFEDISGWEIGGHGFADHIDLRTLTTEQVDTELRSLKEYLRTNRFRGQDHFAWPYGAYNAATMEIAARYFATTRGVGGNNQTMSAAPRDARPVNVLSHAMGAAGVVTLANLKSIVDRAKAHRSWEVFLFHNISTTTSGDVVGQADFDALLAYINAQGVAVAPVGRVVRGA